MLFSRVILFAVTALATPLSISPRQSGLLNGRGVVGITMPQANGQAGYLDANAQYTTNESGKVIFTATNGVLSINGRNVGHGNNGQMAISADNPFIFSTPALTVGMNVLLVGSNAQWYTNPPNAGSSSALYPSPVNGANSVVFLTWAPIPN